MVESIPSAPVNESLRLLWLGERRHTGGEGIVWGLFRVLFQGWFLAWSCGENGVENEAIFFVEKSKRSASTDNQIRFDSESIADGTIEAWIAVACVAP